LDARTPPLRLPAGGRATAPRRAPRLARGASHGRVTHDLRPPQGRRPRLRHSPGRPPRRLPPPRPTPALRSRGGRARPPEKRGGDHVPVCSAGHEAVRPGAALPRADASGRGSRTDGDPNGGRMRIPARYAPVTPRSVAYGTVRRGMLAGR